MAEDKDTEATREDDRNEEQAGSPVPDPEATPVPEDDPEAD
jgi:hypothetical protein